MTSNLCPPPSSRPTGLLDHARSAVTLQLDPVGPVSERGVQVPELRVVDSPDPVATGKLHRVPEGLLTIGRDVGAHELRFEDPQMSRLHARVRWDSRLRCHWLEDHGSSNGTFVNGRSTEPTALSHGDVVRMGDTLLVYESKNPMAYLLEAVRRGARSDLTVLIQGETGSGKELVARSIHDSSGRTGPFVAVNCAALSSDLVATELFGHARGAFSGATLARTGLFRAAEGGTLLLDEIGELPLPLQAALLRAVQERSVRPVGEELEVPVDVRLIAATNLDLEVAVRAGQFREDLYARLAELVFHLPPLRERRGQILELFEAVGDGSAVDITPDAVEALLLWAWPRNVRELRSFKRSFRALSDPSEPLGLRRLCQFSRQMVGPLVARKRTRATRQPEVSRLSDAITREKLRAALAEHGGNVSAAAKALGHPRAKLYRWMRRVGLNRDDFS